MRRTPVVYSRTVIRALVLMTLAGLCFVTGCMMPDLDKQAASNELRMSASEEDPLKALPPVDAEGYFVLGEEPVLAPGFSTEATGDAGFVLAEALTAGPLVLYFYPADDTPNTTRDLLALSRAEDELSAHGIQAYGVGPGSVATHDAYRKRYAIGLPLLADPTLAIARAYGCVSERGRYPQRTTVGIDPEGRVVFYLRRSVPAKEILQHFGISTNGSS